MGTNYYLRIKPCESCGRCETSLHIGKQSAGWKFGFARYKKGAWTYDGRKIERATEWFDLLNRDDHVNNIWDEYDRKLLTDDFMSMVSSQVGREDLRGATDDNYEYEDPDGFRFIKSDPDDWS